ncbi:DUF1572 family protein [Paenibacillus oleatilyticus]|uniref:DUF1572 family protein n=1 Tax=Paenibacillus oleatilyticus TaxID=2594886 RepID=A0ABV4V5E8_9BACL
MNQPFQLGDEFLKESISAFESMKKLADGTISQLEDAHFYETIDPESNSLEILIKHMHGNMISRWTDFLTTDGEFEVSRLPRAELLRLWEEGWERVFQALRSLTPEDVLRTVYIRGEAHTVLKAIQRQVSHYGYHVGQIVFLGKHLKSEHWQTLSIPRKR